MSTFEETVGGIVNELLADHESEKVGENIKIFNHPDKEIIIDIIFSLRKIIFPGYFRNRDIKVYTMKSNLSMLLEDVIFKLTKQITIVLDNDDEDNSDILDRARQISLEFVKRLRTIREYILTDVHAAFDGDPAAYSEDEIIYSYPGLFAILVNRIAHELFLLNVPIIPRMMTEYAHSHTGIDIHPGATIGRFFFIDHGTGVVIGETTVIGEHVKLYQGVTLGAKSFPVGEDGKPVKGIDRHPKIGNNVIIYAGATILGGDTIIGDNSVIGGNVWLTHSVPAGSTILRN